MKLKSQLASISLLLSVSVSAEPLKLDLNRSLFDSFKTGYLTAPCQINQLDTECFIDTGARVSFLKYDDFKEYKKVGSDVGGGAHGNTQVVDLIEVSSFQLGSIFVQSHVFRRAKSGFVSRKNIIGSDLFWGNHLYFDFSNETLDINGVYPMVDEEFELLTFQSKWIGMSAKVGKNKNVKAMWDSGASTTVVSKKLINSSPEDFEFVGHMDTEDASGSIVKTRIMKTSVTIGHRTYRDIDVIELDFLTIKSKVDSDIDMIIGFNIYTQANWLIDYKELVWGFGPN